MRQLTLITLCTLLVAGAANAADKYGQYKSYGAGTDACSEYLVARAAGLPSWEAYGHWLGGFITATNFAVPGTGDLLAGESLDAALGWIDNFCREKPSEPVDVAARGLVLELKTTNVLSTQK